MKGSTGTTRLTPTLQLIIERLLARLYLLVHTKVKPIPLDLDVKLADTLQLAAALLYPAAEAVNTASNQSNGDPNHKHASKTGQAQFAVLADVDPRTLGQFNSKLEKEIQSDIEAKYTKREWLQMSKDKREAMRKGYCIAKLENGGPKNFRVNKGCARGKTIAKLKLDDISVKKPNKTPRAGDEIDVDDTATTNARPFFFPKTRQEAMAHLTSLLTTSGAFHRGNGRFGTVPRGNEEEEIMRNIAVVPRPPSTTLARQAQWSEDLCRCFIDVSDNCGMLSPVILGAAVSGVASECLDVVEESYTPMEVGAPSLKHNMRRGAGRRCLGSEEESETDEDTSDDDDDDEASEGSDDNEMGRTSSIYADDYDDDDDDGSDDDNEDDEFEENEEDEETTQMGPKAFGVTKRECAVDPEEDLVNRMFHQMLLQSTTRAMSGNNMDLQMIRKAEQRLTGSTYQSAVKKALNGSDAVNKSSILPAQASSHVPTPTTTEGSPKAPTTVKFAVLRKSGANKVEATAIELPISHKFVSEAQKDIAKTVRDRECTRRKTIELSLQQEKEKYDDDIRKAVALDEKEKRELQRSAPTAAKDTSHQMADNNHKDDRVMSIRFGKC